MKNAENDLNKIRFKLRKGNTNYLSEMHLHFRFKIKDSLIYIGLFLFSACSGNRMPSDNATDTPTSGEVSIVVDESFQQLFDTQIYTFQSLNKEANIHAKYLPENRGLKLLIQDSCKVIVMCRDITKGERKNFEAANLYPISTKLQKMQLPFLLTRKIQIVR